MKPFLALPPVLATLAWSAAANVLYGRHPMVTPPPDLAAMARRDINPSTITSYSAIEKDAKFQGWYTTGNSAEAIMCDSGYSWSTSKTLGRCCPTSGSCPQLVSCIDNSHILQADGSTTLCGASLACGLLTVFAQPPSVSPVSNIFCHNAWNAWTIYRDLASAVSSSSSSTSSTASSSDTTASTSPSTSSSPDSTEQNSGGGSSNTGAIVGGVVGGVVGFALVAGLAYFLYRRDKAKRNADVNQPFIPPDQQPEFKAYQPPPQEQFAYSNPNSGYPPSSAFPATPSEADSQPITRVEMDAAEANGAKRPAPIAELPAS